MRDPGCPVLAASWPRAAWQGCGRAVRHGPLAHEGRRASAACADACLRAHILRHTASGCFVQSTALWDSWWMVSPRCAKFPTHRMAGRGGQGPRSGAVQVRQRNENGERFDRPRQRAAGRAGRAGLGRMRGRVGP